MADLENGIWGGAADHSTDDISWIDANAHDFITAMLKGGSNGFGLRGGNAQAGELRMLYDGRRPNHYQPMKKQGALILGIGGDNSDRTIGTFYEGCVTAGLASNATDALIQANIVAAGYGQAIVKTVPV